MFSGLDFRAATNESIPINKFLKIVFNWSHPG